MTVLIAAPVNKPNIPDSFDKTIQNIITRVKNFTLPNILLMMSSNYLIVTFFRVNVQGKFINCLMYADDLLILSENEQGLNESLQRLGKYTEKWNLKISDKKTKIMIFNKSGKTVRLTIKVNGILINSCTEYTY